jgi:hypothetical protein
MDSQIYSCHHGLMARSSAQGCGAMHGQPDILVPPRFNGQELCTRLRSHAWTARYTRTTTAPGDDRFFLHLCNFLDDISSKSLRMCVLQLNVDSVSMLSKIA